MDADLASYLDESVPSLQDGAGRVVDCTCAKKNICSFLKESRAVVADLMVDQPFFLLLSAFVSGLLLGRSLFSGKKPS
ncbi:MULTISPECIES: hypothetical protein [unclassified Gluconobacter]|uniref:hypothetical protein n=1 Tax=unclassified Gluconobacter TaxID=2644261 RepID=UPI001764E53E|nr:MULTISPECIES: hypothetical protein [unclassified Gluconobacter]GFE96864.1 hypothetical protein DmGdi_19370 [Gluconobacter sp. Gdi]